MKAGVRVLRFSTGQSKEVSFDESAYLIPAEILLTAARQIGLMRTTVGSARQQDSASLQKLKDVFGEELNLNDIERTVDILDSGILRISSWQATFPDRNILAVANKAKHAVSIGREFYDDVVTPDWLRIGVLIHEATRLLGGTTDSWEWSDDSKTSVFPAARGSSNLLSGRK